MRDYAPEIFAWMEKRMDECVKAGWLIDGVSIACTLSGRGVLSSLFLSPDDGSMSAVFDKYPQRSMARQVVGLAGWLILAFAAASIGAIASLNAGSFYGELQRPAWAPAAWLFGPVWSVLYLLMGIAAWLVWRTDGFRINRAALVLFVLQLAANALWTWVFFAWHQGAAAFAEILLLWALIVATLRSFRRLNTLAGLLLVPYLAWVTFAAALTLGVWRLNPGTL